MSNPQYFLMSETVRNLLFENGKPKDDCFYYVNYCPLCENKKIKKLFSQWGIDYYRCDNCEFVFSNPRLTNKGAYLWYNSDYYNAAMKTEHYIAENFSKYYSISLNDYHLNKLIELFNTIVQNKTLIIADIGCGSGAVLHYLKDKLEFNNLKGFDLTSYNIQFAKMFRNITIEIVDVFDLNDDTKFDVVITTENIEHVSYPIKYVEQIKKIIKPGGYLFLTTPHNDKIATKLMELSGDHFCAPNHQNYFNLNNLSELLAGNKFEVVSNWIDKSNKFNLYAFIKNFFIKRDQVTALPPINPLLKSIWKWQKDLDKSIFLSDYKSNNILMNNTVSLKKKFKLKPFIKNLFKNLIPLKFETHQIIVARFDG